MIKASFNNLYDAGYDPRFTSDGWHFDSNKYAPPHLLKRIYNYICNLFQTLRELFPATASFQTLLSKTIKTEYQLSESLLKTRFPQKYFCGLEPWGLVVEHVHYRDNLFLESTGKLFKFLVQAGKCKAHTSTLPGNIFPRALLNALYSIDAPQSNLFNREFNGDLARSGGSGFVRLNPQDNNPNHLPDLVDHCTFIDATASTAKVLKDKARQWRLCLIETQAALKAGKSNAVIEADVVAKISAFYNAWMDYVNSHEVVSEVYEVLSEKNYHKKDDYEGFLRNREPYDPVQFIKSLFIKRKSSDNSEMDKAFLARAEKGPIDGKINKTALVYKQLFGKN